jgi:hypothetical protein
LITAVLREAGIYYFACMETQDILTPLPEPLKLSWREKYAGILVLILGFFYLILEVLNFASSKAEAYAVKEGAMQLSTSELVNDVRSILVILLGILGGWLLLKGKRAGWVMGIPILVLVTLAAGYLVVIGFGLMSDLEKALGISFFLLILLALLFLLLPSARRKYKVGTWTYLPTVLLMAVLAALYFLL